MYNPKTKAAIKETAEFLCGKEKELGLLDVLMLCAPGSPVRIPYREFMKDIGVQELNLSVRSSNCLMRAGLVTYGKLNERLQDERGLSGIRNLGTRSEHEIIYAFLNDTYHRLSQESRTVYWERVLTGEMG